MGLRLCCFASLRWLRHLRYAKLSLYRIEGKHKRIIVMSRSLFGRVVQRLASDMSAQIGGNTMEGLPVFTGRLLDTTNVEDRISLLTVKGLPQCHTGTFSLVFPNNALKAILGWRSHPKLNDCKEV